MIELRKEKKRFLFSMLMDSLVKLGGYYNANVVLGNNPCNFGYLSTEVFSRQGALGPVVFSSTTMSIRNEGLYTKDFLSEIRAYNTAMQYFEHFADLEYEPDEDLRLFCESIDVLRYKGVDRLEDIVFSLNRIIELLSLTSVDEPIPISTGMINGKLNSRLSVGRNTLDIKSGNVVITPALEDAPGTVIVMFPANV